MPPAVPRRRAVLLTTLTATALVTAGLPAAADDEPVVRRFDFGTATSPVGDGWTGVPDASRYSADAGFGIVTVGDAVPISRDRATAADPVAGDFVLGTAWQFVVDVPDGAYEVQVLSGDQLAGTSTTKTEITLEGAVAGTVQARQSVSEATYRATVADGQLTIGVAGAGAGGYVNAITVTPVTDEPDPGPDPEEPVPTLPAPESVRMAHVTPDAVTLRWDEVADATGYVVSRADAVGGPYTVVAETPARVVFTTDAVDTSTAHYYRVQARHTPGLSAPSAAAVSSLTGTAPTLPVDGVLTFDLGSGARSHPVRPASTPRPRGRRRPAPASSTCARSPRPTAAPPTPPARTS